MLADLIRSVQRCDDPHVEIARHKAREAKGTRGTHKQEATTIIIPIKQLPE